MVFNLIKSNALKCASEAKLLAVSFPQKCKIYRADLQLLSNIFFSILFAKIRGNSLLQLHREH